MKEIKILGIAGSPRKNMSSYNALEYCMKKIKEYNSKIEFKIIRIADYQIYPCQACGKCQTGLHCSINDDFTKLIPFLTDEAIKSVIISTPVYMGSMSAQTKAFLDRSVMLRRNGFLWKNKIGAGIAVGHSRNGGQEITIQALHASMLIHDMLVVSDGADTAHFGGTVCSGYEFDKTGYRTLDNLAKKIADLSLIMQ